MSGSPPTTAGPLVTASRENEQVLGAMLVLHGLVHVVGFLLGWKIFAPRGFSYDDVWPAAGTWPGRGVGLSWLVVGASIAVVGVRMSSGRGVPAGALVASLLASVAVCATAFPHAIPGAVISGGVLVAVGIVRVRRRQWRGEAQRRTFDPGGEGAGSG